jgi:hypothetical protein
MTCTSYVSGQKSTVSPKPSLSASGGSRKQQVKPWRLGATMKFCCSKSPGIRKQISGKAARRVNLTVGRGTPGDLSSKIVEGRDSIGPIASSLGVRAGSPAASRCLLKMLSKRPRYCGPVMVPSRGMATDGKLTRDAPRVFDKG